MKKLFALSLIKQIKNILIKKEKLLKSWIKSMKIKKIFNKFSKKMLLMN